MRETTPQQRQPVDPHLPKHALYTLLHEDGSAGPDAPRLDDAACVSLYRSLLQLRVLDRRMVALGTDGALGFYVSSEDTEATILGGAFALRATDWIFPSYREAAVALWRGLPLVDHVSQLVGNARDASKGRQQPMHGAWKALNIVSISSLAGTQLPQATGMALAAKVSKKDDVALVYFGEGSTSTGDFHVGLNFAGVWKAPVVFLCRNDVAARHETAASSYAEKGRGYGVTSVRVDGDDVLAVIAAVRGATERARRGEGPTLVEAVSTGTDAVERFRRHLEHRKLWTPELGDLEHTLSTELDTAIAEARLVSPPPIDTMFDDVYAVPSQQLVDQRAQLLRTRRTDRSEA